MSSQEDLSELRMIIRERTRMEIEQDYKNERQAKLHFMDDMVKTIIHDLYQNWKNRFPNKESAMREASREAYLLAENAYNERMKYIKD